MNTGLHNMYQLSNARSRSITAENFTGEKGGGAKATEGTGKEAARELGIGWKVSPSIVIQPGQKVEIAHIRESGCIRHIWCTAFSEKWRKLIIRMYWDGEGEPSVEVPMADFFCNGWGVFSAVNSAVIAANPHGGFHSYFPMPFENEARIVVENCDETETVFFYQIDYVLTDIGENTGRFHAQLRMSKPVKDGVHIIADHIEGKGQFVGTYMAIQVNNNGWWGEGEVKFYLDGDMDYPTICGTGTEDYFGGAWNFEYPKGKYCEHSGIYSGLNQVIRPDGLYNANTRFGMYRFHVLDPIYFEKNLKVTIQDLGWREGGRYLKRADEITTVAYWYQTEPHHHFPEFPNRDSLEVI